MAQTRSQYDIKSIDHAQGDDLPRDHDARPSSPDGQSQRIVLQAVPSTYSYLDLSRKVHNISTAQHGHGGYSDIFIGYYSPNGVGGLMKVAIKRLRVHIMGDVEFQKKLAKELYIWSKLKHPNILPLEGFYLGDDQYPSLVSKWMENGTILDYLDARPHTDLLAIVIGITQSLEYLHYNEVVHSDIKPDNVIISESGTPLLSDFGISRLLSASKTFHFTSTITGGLHGTIRFMSKELLTATDSELPTYSKESDVWAFGMTVYTILTKRPPFYHINTEPQVMFAITQGKLPSRPRGGDLWPVRNQILWRMIHFYWRPPTERPQMLDFLTELSVTSRS